MKIASWNVNSLNVRLQHLEEWLKSRQPDVVVLQETKMEDHKFPDDALLALGYRSVFIGQKTYNGVAIVSRTKALDVQFGIPGFDDEQRRVIAATVNDIRIVNLYVVNGQDLGTDKYDYKIRWLEALHNWLAEEVKKYPNLVVLGDFNIAPDDRDVYDPKIWNDNSILTSTAERAAYQKILNLGLHDSFRLHNDEAGHFSWWDFRSGGFRRDNGLRIDLILISDALKSKCIASEIDREPRTWERPSDHTPVMVELADS
ncbi:MAG: exodeoxyribonuclease III [Arenimonas sp.]